MCPLAAPPPPPASCVVLLATSLVFFSFLASVPVSSACRLFLSSCLASPRRACRAFVSRSSCHSPLVPSAVCLLVPLFVLLRFSPFRPVAPSCLSSGVGDARAFAFRSVLFYRLRFASFRFARHPCLLLVDVGGGASHPASPIAPVCSCREAGRAVVACFDFAGSMRAVCSLLRCRGRCRASGCLLCHAASSSSACRRAGNGGGGGEGAACLPRDVVACGGSVRRGHGLDAGAVPCGNYRASVVLSALLI